MHRLLAAVLAVLILLVGTAGAAGADSVYLGSWNTDQAGRSEQLAELREFDAWSGQRSARVLDFVATANATWEQIAGDGYASRVGELPWDVRRRLLVSVPMLASGAGLQGCADGRYSQHFRALGGNLARIGMRWNDLRLGHEMNGDWYRWSSRSRPDLYRACWVRVHDALRAGGFSGRLVFSPMVGSSTNLADATLAYPGDRYVGVVAPDVYDQWVTWDELRNGPRGLRFWAGFARQHGKDVGLSEWGVVDRGHGGRGDNPFFVREVHRWLADEHRARPGRVRFAVLFNVRSWQDHYIGPRVTAFPGSGAEYRRLAW